MQRVIIVLLIVIAVAIGVYLVSGDKPADPAPTVTDAEKPEQQAEGAEEYVQELTGKGPIDPEEGGFVSGDQPVTLGTGQEAELTSIGEVVANESPDTPVTLVRENLEIVMVTLRLLAGGGPSNPCIENGESTTEQAADKPDKKIRVFENDQIVEFTLSELIARYNNNLEQKIPVVVDVEHREVTTVGELDKSGEGEVIKGAYGLETATIDELLGHEKFEEDGRIYYVRNVQSDDAQGIWGIIHDGLVKNFACGIALKRGESVDKYQVEIPSNADELRQDSSSSFLGRMIDKKTSESHVYNHREGKMGKNPNLVYPEQEIVIVGFMPEELVEIYRHFVARAAN